MDEFLTHLHSLQDLFENAEIRNSLDDIELIGRQLKYSQEYLLTEIQRLKNDFNIQTKKIQQANHLRDIDQKTLQNFQRNFQEFSQIFSNIKKKEINTWHLVQILRVNTSRLWHIFETATGSTITQEMFFEDLQKLFDQSQVENLQYQSNLNFLEKEHGDLLIQIKDIQLNLEQFRLNILQLTQSSNTLKTRMKTQQLINNHIHEQTTKIFNQFNRNKQFLEDLLIDYQYLLNEIHSLEKLIYQIQTEFQIHQKSILIYQTKYEKYKQDLILVNLNRIKCQNQMIILRKFLSKQNQIFQQLENEEKQIQFYRQNFHQQIDALEKKKMKILTHQQQLIDEIKQKTIKNHRREKDLFLSHRINQNLQYTYRRLVDKQTKQQNMTNRLYKTIENNQKQIDIIKNEFNRYVDDVNEQNQLIESKEIQIVIQTKENLKLENCLSRTEDELSQQRSKIQTNQTTIKSMMQKIYKLNGDEKPLSKDISYYQKQIRYYRTNHHQLNSQLKQNEEKIHLYQTLISKLIFDTNKNECILTKEQILVEKYRKQIEQMKEKTKSANRNLQKTDENYQHIKDVVIDIDYENQKLKKQYTDLTFVIQLLGEKQITLNNQLKPLYEKLTRLTQHHLQQTKTINQLQIDLFILQKYYFNLQSSNQQLQQRLSLSSRLTHEDLHSSSNFKLKKISNHIHQFQLLMIHSPEQYHHLFKFFLIKKKLMKKSTELLNLKGIIREKTMLFHYLNKRNKFIKKYL